MADILIRGIEMPTMAQAYKTLIVSYDGKVYEGVHPQPTVKKKEPIAKAVELPEHGDLIDRDAFREENEYYLHREFINPKYEDTLDDLLKDAPVIVPASKEETE